MTTMYAFKKDLLQYLYELCGYEGWGVEGPDGVRQKAVFITPEMARVFLSHNPINRNKKPVLIKSLVARLKAGRFFFTHQGIAFDVSGVLLDGQNRLEAISQAETGAWFYIVIGLPTEARMVTDTGTARVAADRLRMMGESCPDSVGPVVNAICCGLWIKTDRTDADAEQKRLAEYKLGLDFLRKVGDHKEIKTPVMAAFVYAYAKDPQLVEEVHHMFVSKDVPAHTSLSNLRDYANRTSISSSGARHTMFLSTLTALWSYKRGTKSGQVSSALNHFASAYGKTYDITDKRFGLKQ